MNNESRSLENTLLILTQIGVEGDCLRNASIVNSRNYRIKVCTCEGCIQRCVQYSKSIRKEEVGLTRKSKDRSAFYRESITSIAFLTIHHMARRAD